jgi:hypothetical protein
MRSLLRYVGVLAGLSGLGAAQPPAYRPVARMLYNVKVESPWRYENLTVFPLTGGGAGNTSYTMLDAAITSGTVKVQEKDGGQVNTVRVRNDGKTYVFGMAGEIISGARQDRMLQNDVLLPPGSGWVDVPVFCTEHGRWEGSSTEFGTRGQVVAGRVRERAAKTQSQTEVWAEVDAARADLGVETPTRAFAKVYDAPRVQAKVEAYADKLGDLPDVLQGAQGVAVAVGSRLVCVDAFGSTALFRKMWPKLLRSYVIDAVSQQPSGRLRIQDVQQFMKTAAGAEVVAQPTVGAGSLCRLSARNASGSALVFGREIVHLDLFPNGGGMLDDPGNTPRLEFRRQKSQR